MRLKTIKLNGFKSFVEPTTLPLRGNLIAIVGPNGCGKSNVVDAIRWVLGESSARQLRSESMADVIFNGTSKRHPLGQASVELVFDNAQGKLGGAYAAYEEISVKRLVTRAGQSSYSLNGARCRRRDVADIFLGTGLGARGYSIIEQGMISRIIDARPEDLRTYVEEAAGISRYRERRKETETRIAHAKDNMVRLTDLRAELQRQQQALERQSRNAERYQQLAAQERQTRAALLALRIGKLSSQADACRLQIAGLDTVLEEELARQRRLEAEIEKGRLQQQQFSDELNQVQAAYYSLGADISTTEQMLEHNRAARLRMQQEIDALRLRVDETQAHLETDAARLAVVGAKVELAEQAHREQDLQYRQSEQTLRHARQIAEPLAGALSALDARLANTQRQVYESRNACETGLVRIQGNETRRAALLEQQGQTDQEEWRASLTLAQSKLEESQSQRSRLEEACSRHEQALGELRNRQLGQQQKLAARHGEIQLTQGKIDALQAWQRTLVVGNTQAETWLERNRLRDAPTLGLALRVEPAWQKAVEMVLGSLFAARGVGDLAKLVTAQEEVSVAGLMLVDMDAEAAAEPTNPDLPLLADQVSAPWNIADLLVGIHRVDSVAQGLAWRDRLAPGASLITPQGTWLGRSWIRYFDAGQETHLFDTNQQLTELEQVRANLLAEQDQQQEAQNDLRRELLEAEAELVRLRQRSQAVQAQCADLVGECNLIRSHLQRGEEQQRRLLQELDSLAVAIQRDRLLLAQHEQQQTDAEQRLETLRRQRLELEQQATQAATTLAEAQQHCSEQRETLHQTSLQLQQGCAEQGELERGLQRAEQQSQREQQRLRELRQNHADSDQPLAALADRLQELLARRGSGETQLQQARERQQLGEHLIRDLDRQRLGTLHEVQQQRENREALRLSQQDLLTQIAGATEQLEQLAIDITSVAPAVDSPTGDSEERLREELGSLRQKIEHLGPVNLAAIEEFAQLQKRRDYLDQQHGDLEDALATMEGAMRKIDRETRTQFRDTFHKINLGLQNLFPRLFGGGHAYLDLHGEEVLDADIGFMAQPPGKKNTGIQQLSGGEKALSAIAFLFAIFDLNPAPFCVLDEVDAPLDDVNVGRFSQLVRDMSSQVQFLFVTHNKGTMEIAHQLTGVTMSEAGVSRLVAVDLDQALQIGTATT